MIAFIALVLAALILAFLGYPLLRARSREGEERSAEEERLEALLLSRDSAYSALKELEFDHEVGSLSEEDYRALDERYKAKAVSLLKSIDAVEKGESLEERIEEEVLKLRQARGRPSGPFCSQCGQRVRSGDRFCSRCGAKLSPGGSQ